MATAIPVLVATNNRLFAQYAREAPYDGQDGLAALMGALEVSMWTLIGMFVGLYLLQRFLTKNRT
jgi:hypothetical protein